MRKHVRANLSSVHNSSSGAMGEKKKNKKARALAQKRRETMDGRGGKEERGAVGREARCSLLWHILEKVSDPRRDSGPSRERETV